MYFIFQIYVWLHLNWFCVFPSICQNRARLFFLFLYKTGRSQYGGKIKELTYMTKSKDLIQSMGNLWLLWPLSCVLVGWNLLALCTNVGLMGPSCKNLSPSSLDPWSSPTINCQQKVGELWQPNHMRERGAQSIYDHSHYKLAYLAVCTVHVDAKFCWQFHLILLTR